MPPTKTVSEPSWGETSGIYPTDKNLYNPAKWDKAKTEQLLKARAAIHDVSKRNSDVRKDKPDMGDKIEALLSEYHIIETFPALDAEITPEVKWFYLSKESKVDKHPGAPNTKWVKAYGPFHNVGGGDVPKGNIYIHFYKFSDKEKLVADNNG